MDIRASANNNPSATVSAPPEPYVILGAGGFAREVFYHIFDAYSNFFNIAQNYAYLPSYFIFVDDVTPGLTELNTGKGVFRVVKDWAFDRDYQFVVGVGSPSVKETMVNKALQKGLTPAATVVHPRALVQNAQIGVGGIVTPGCVVTTDVTIGDYVILNLNTTVGHDAVIGDFCTINPGVAVSGNTTLGRKVFMGTGSCTREKISVADNVVIGANAAVVKNITEPGITVVGVPAKKLVHT